MSCDYLFGNLVDMKRHLRVRHSVAPHFLKDLDSDIANILPANPDQVRRRAECTCDVTLVPRGV